MILQESNAQAKIFLILFLVNSLFGFYATDKVLKLLFTGVYAFGMATYM